MSRDQKHSEVVAEVVAILREERERTGLSMNAVAARAGISIGSVSYVERGMRNPTLETLLRMADAIGADMPKVLAKALKRAGTTST